jgi:hypothetical protein
MQKQHARKKAIALLDSSIRQRYSVSPSSLAISFQLMDGSVVLGRASFESDQEDNTSSLERRCYLDALNMLMRLLEEEPTTPFS